MTMDVIAEQYEFDVKLSRSGTDPFDLGDAVTNVPWTVIHHSPTGFEWGYSGSGCADLALNVLNAFIPPGKDNLPAVTCYKGECSQTAWDLHQGFKQEFIATMPKNGGIIKKGAILSYIGRYKGFKR